MNVRYMGSIDSYSNSSGENAQSALGACGHRYRFDQGRAVKGISGNGFRRIALAPGRGLFLGIVKGNLDGIASKLQKVDPGKLKKNWENAGGDFSKLQAAIKTGASKPAKKLGLLGFIRKRLRPKGGVNGIGAASENDIKAAIVAGATAVGTAVAPGVGSGAGAAIGAALVAILPIVIDLVSQTPDSEMTDVVIPNPVSAESDVTDQAAPQEGTKFNLQGALPLIAIGAGALYLATRKK